MLGGDDDDAAHLELWECNPNRFRVLVEDAHEYGISCINELKKEYKQEDGGYSYYIATASCDNVIKAWKLDLSRKHSGEFEVSIALHKKRTVHTEYISCLLTLHRCGLLQGGVILSGSHDQSVNFWRWEADEQCLMHSQRATTAIESEESKDRDDILVYDGVDTDKYCTKMRFAHTDFVKALALLHDKEDFSDLVYFATAGGDTMVKIWDLREKKLIKAFSNNNKTVLTMTYLGDGKIATSANNVQMKKCYIHLYLELERCTAADSVERPQIPYTKSATYAKQYIRVCGQ